MTTMNRTEIHADHSHWQSDIQSWHEDLEAWRKQQAKLLVDFEGALGAHVQSMKEHLGAIERHVEVVRCHERFIAEREQSSRSGPGEIEARMAKAHEKGLATHEELRRTHQRMKGDHHEAMAKLMVVLQILAHPEER